MEIILLKNYEGMGEAGDVVKVKPGFARNKLIPDGVALRASKRNMAIAKEKKQYAITRKVREEAANDALAESISKTEITIEAQVGEEDKMFGSITSIDIHKSLMEKGIKVDRQSIVLDEPIKALGIYHVPVRVAPKVRSDVKIYVIKS